MKGSPVDGSVPERLLKLRHVETNFENYVDILNDKEVEHIECDIYALPDVFTYTQALQFYIIPLAVCGGVAVCILVYLFINTLAHVLSNCKPGIKSCSVHVISVYPVVGAMAFCGMMIPRTQLLVEAITQCMLMTTFYQLISLFIAYCGGEVELLKTLKPNLNLKVPPCCCWPCCKLPILTINRKNLTFARLLVLQMPLATMCFYIVQLMLWFEDKALYNAAYLYFQPFVIVSILLGIWGLNIWAATLNEALKEFNVRKKMLALQLVLVTSKLQYVIAKQIGIGSVFNCLMGISPAVFCNDVYYMVLLMQIVPLSYWASSLYKKNIPESVELATEDRFSNRARERISNNTGDRVIYARNLQMIDDNTSWENNSKISVL